MQTFLLAAACVLLAVWGAGSVAHLLAPTPMGSGGWLGAMPRAAAGLIFAGMLFGPSRAPAHGEDDETP